MHCESVADGGRLGAAVVDAKMQVLEVGGGPPPGGAPNNFRGEEILH